MQPLQRPIHAALLILIPALASLASAQDDAVEDFRRYFKKYTDTATRVEAVLSLSGYESERVVEVLLPVLKDDDPDVVWAAVRVLAGFRTAGPEVRLAEELEDASSLEVQVGILRAVALGSYSRAVEAVVPLLEDRDWAVRVAAIEALGAATAEAGDAWILPLCADPEPPVACAAFDALAARGSERVLEPAREALDAESWQVRASAIEALATVRHRDSIGPLVTRLEKEEGRLRQDIAEALASITGRDFGLRADAWRRFWDAFGDEFRIPTAEDRARLAAQRKVREARYTTDEDGVSFYGIRTPSHAILFVIDVSASMAQEIVDRAPYEDLGLESHRRIDLVKHQLAKTIEALAPHVEFNVMAFASDVRQWKRALVPASRYHKDVALRWIERLEPIGAPSQQRFVPRERAAQLLVQERGRTNSYGALMTALDVAGRGTRDRHYEVGVDTIFFLSDGAPSHGELIATDDIRREVGRANDLRRVVIHTVAIGDFHKDFMQRLAWENGGTFVDLGR